tara:strand:+ start:24 stop:299 length:276 start_codon:yes stop_codon:yes gene_type:complete
MKWLRTLWNNLVKKTSVSPTLVVVEEERCGEIFAHLCREAGVKQRTIDNAGLVEIFENWYDGACDKESILKCMDAFKAAHPIANAKLQNKL